MSGRIERRNRERRGDPDRRQSGTDMNDQVYTMLLDRLDNFENNKQSSNKGDQLTFTLPQILGALFAIITIGGSLLAAWTNLNNQITTQKVSTDLIIAQIRKDVDAHEAAEKALGVRIDGHTSQTQVALDRLSTRLEDLDNSVNQLYSHTSQKK